MTLPPSAKGNADRIWRVSWHPRLKPAQTGRQSHKGKPMDNLSTANTDISSQIGALELGDHLESRDDGVLEAAVVNPPPQPTQPRIFGGNCASDGALEAAANPSPMTQNLSCPTILGCRHHDDSVLEAAVNPTPLPTLPRAMGGMC
jgi:hypothetical protein